MIREGVYEIRFWWFILVDTEWLRSRATMYRRYNGHAMFVCIHLVAPFHGKSPLARHHVAAVHVQWRPELARLKLREPRWRTYGYAIHLKMVPPFKARHVESFFWVRICMMMPHAELWQIFWCGRQEKYAGTHDRFCDIEVTNLAIWRISRWNLRNINLVSS